jgi:serine/threonine protein kinase
LKDDLFQGILSDGQEIAVKTLLGRTGHGLQQLHNEVVLLAELQHKNLVRLQGFCSHQNDTLLVYEYIKNGSLDSFLFGIFLSIYMFTTLYFHKYIQNSVPFFMRTLGTTSFLELPRWEMH